MTSTDNELKARLAEARAAFDAHVGDLRPRLHRYCARMTGSAIDGEDVVQDALAKAFFALTTMTAVRDLEPWLFRIAHNAAIDHLRRRARHDDRLVELDADALADPTSELEDRQAASAALAAFMHLAPLQRSCVILKDVLGHSIAEIARLLDSTEASVKAALHRGRARLKAVAGESAETPKALPEPERALHRFYADRFNARDFDAIRARLAEEVRLDLVGRARRRGAAEVGDYFANYARVTDWHAVPGFVDGRPALLIADPERPDERPSYFILIDWSDDQVAAIRDFRYARYVIGEAEIARADA